MFEEVDSKLTSYLNQISSGKSDYWSFAGNDERTGAHKYFQYPAMMVPQMQRSLLQAVIHAAPSTRSVYDPFVGSGTVLTEAMMQGLSFVGRDVNPLAILLCRVKSEALNFETISQNFIHLKHEIMTDTTVSIDIEFPNRDKWFRKDAAEQLSKIRRAILKVGDLHSRRFFWIALAETVRLTSNSRTSNFKLYVRPEEERQTRDIRAVELFTATAQTNLEQLREYQNALQAKGLLEHNHYKRDITIELGDTKKIVAADEKLDLLVTSPPYGDNNTTVTYGQYSYLPLQWIDLKDIDPNVDPSYVCSTHEIDRRSLGGSLADVNHALPKLKERSRSFAAIVHALKDQPADRVKRIAAFCRDLDITLDPILYRLKPGAILIWTIGNRRVGGMQVPTDEILEQLLNSRGVRLIGKLQREFPANSKRMENLSNTMDSEKILIMRTGLME
jgi:site-specific DNA-adenine methylase